MTKIEEVARAIETEIKRIFSHGHDLGLGTFEVFEVASFKPLTYKRIARAAIEAMREPDDAMRKAVNDLYRDHARGRLEKPDADEIWPVMIDAALKETP